MGRRRFGRADSVVTLHNGVDGPTAETLTGRVVQLTRNDYPSKGQLAKRPSNGLARTSKYHLRLS